MPVIVDRSRPPRIVVVQRRSNTTVGSIATETVVQERPSTVAVSKPETRAVAVGTRGPQGPRGPAGEGAAYVHDQTAPAATWTINHNLGFRPSVELFDAAGHEFDGAIRHLSANTVLVELTTPAAGTARLN